MTAPFERLRLSPTYGLFGRWLQILALAAPLFSSADAMAAQKRVLAFGDSLTAGFGLPAADALTAQLEKRLQADGFDVKVINAGVSGDTTAAGLARLGFTLDGLPRKPDLVIVGLGANDMLRGLSPAQTRANLQAMLDELKRREVRVALTTMMAAPNLGEDYARAFNPIYADLARSSGASLYPFFLEGVAGQPDKLLPDGMHPNAQGVEIIAKKIAPAVAGDLPKG